MAISGSRLHNPNYEATSAQTISWTRAEAGKYPCDHSTACCDKRIYEGEFAVTIPASFPTGEKRGDGRGQERTKGTVVLHARCLHKFMDSVPDDLVVIEEHVAAMKKEFIK